LLGIYLIYLFFTDITNNAASLLILRQSVVVVRVTETVMDFREWCQNFSWSIAHCNGLRVILCLMKYHIFHYTRVGTLIVATIYLQLIQN